MNTAQSFRDLLVWQQSHQWVLGVYRISKDFPKAEIFGLTSQLRRSASSVPANIVEGFKRRGKADKIRFYNIAQASLDEAAYHLLLAHDLDYADTTALQSKAEEIARMLATYIQRMTNS